MYVLLRHQFSDYFFHLKFQWIFARALPFSDPVQEHTEH